MWTTPNTAKTDFTRLRVENFQGAASAQRERAGARDLQRVIEQRLRGRQEAEGMRQAAMPIEGRLVDPARVDVEEVSVLDRTVGFDEDAARLGPRRRHDHAQ